MKLNFADFFGSPQVTKHPSHPAMKNILLKPAIAVLASIHFLLPSCAGQKNSPLADPSVLRGKSVVRAEHAMPAMAAVTPGKAVGMAFGPIGGAIAGGAMVSAGNEIVRENKIEDPAATVSQDLIGGLVKRHGMKPAGSKLVSEGKPQEIAKSGGGADYVLDVRTLYWQIGYRPMRLGTYWMTHNQQMRLIDCRSGKVIAEGFSIWNPSDEAHFYNYETMAENGAVGLKKEAKHAAESAKSHFRGSILKL